MPACSSDHFPACPPPSPPHHLTATPTVASAETHRSVALVSWEASTSSPPSSPGASSPVPSSPTPSSPNTWVPQTWWPSPWSPSSSVQPSSCSSPGERSQHASELMRASLQNATAALRLLLMGCFQCTTARSGCCRREEDLEKAWFDCEQLQVEHPFCYANPVALAALQGEAERPSLGLPTEQLEVRRPASALPRVDRDLRSMRPRNLLFENEGRVLQACRAMSKSLTSEKDVGKIIRVPRARPRLGAPSRPQRGDTHRVRRRHLRKDAPQVQQAETQGAASSSVETQTSPRALNTSERVNDCLTLLEDVKSHNVGGKGLENQGVREVKEDVFGQKKKKKKALKEDVQTTEEGKNHTEARKTSPSRAEHPEAETLGHVGDSSLAETSNSTTAPSLPDTETPQPQQSTEDQQRVSFPEDDILAGEDFEDDMSKFNAEVSRFESQATGLKDDLWSPAEIEGVFECFNMVSWYSYGGGSGHQIKSGFAKHSPDNNNNSSIKLCRATGEREFLLPLPYKENSITENEDHVSRERKCSLTEEELYEKLFSDQNTDDNSSSLSSSTSSSSRYDNDLIVFKGRSFNKTLLIDLVRESNADFESEYGIANRLGSHTNYPQQVVRSQVMSTLCDVSGSVQDDRVLIPPEIEAVREATMRHRRREDPCRRSTPTEEMIRRTVLQELQKEGKLWHNVQQEEKEVKEETTAEIMDMLLEETTSVIDSIISKKRAIFSAA